MSSTTRKKRKGRNRKAHKPSRKQNLKNDFERKILHSLRKQYGRRNVKYEDEKLPYTIEYTYLPDFKVTLEDGSVLYVEAKGYFDYAAQRKMKAVKRCHPDKRFLIVFQKNGKVRKGGTMTYSDWCEKHGFDYVIHKD